MPYKVVLFLWRRPNLTPTQFHDYYENNHVPIMKALCGDTFPKTHVRNYVQRSTTPDTNGNYPATVIVGGQDDFSYDAWAELIFDDEDAFKRLHARVSEPDRAKLIAEDEENFLDRSKLRAVVVGEVNVTKD